MRRLHGRNPFRTALRLGVLVYLALTVFVFPAEATIGSAYQLLLGNPSGATADPNNHNHYLIERDIETLDYSDNLRQPNWASWNYTSGDSGSSGRSSYFYQDTSLPAGFYQVLTTDYSGSGYDRGHLCPSADRTDTVEHNDETFFMSNMMPQAPDNNQGIWANLENYSRAIAASNEVLVICGPQGFGTNRTTSTGNILIASNTWKIIVAVPLGAGATLSRITNSTRVIAVNIPNIQGIRTTPWQNYLTSVNELQTNTGFTFFTTLNPKLAAVLRAKVDGSPATGITNISPGSGVVGTPVVIRGTNFNGTVRVTFNGIDAPFTLTSANQLTATVPAGTATGPVEIIAAGGLATSSGNFTVNNLVIARPTLTITKSGSDVLILWPTNTIGFTLQQNADLATANWVTYAGTITNSGTNNIATITNAAAQCFFRLVSP